MTQSNPWNLNTAEEALCGVLQVADADRRRSDALRLLRILGSESATRFAARNDVAPLLAHALMECDLPAAEREGWRTLHEQARQSMQRTMQELDHLGDLLHGIQVPVVALKNAGIARGLHDCCACCPMGDLDLLVDPRDFRRAHRQLLADGYHFEFRSPLEEADLEAAERGGGGEYWKSLDRNSRIWVELQWRPVAGRWIRPDREPSAQALLQRAVPIPGSRVRLLAPEDNLLQVCLHTAKHSYVRAPGFRLHTDVDRIVHYQSIDWDRFLERAQAAHLKTCTYYSLQIPCQLMGTPIPRDVLNVLQPARWKRHRMERILASAGLFDPQESKFPPRTYLLLAALMFDNIWELLRCAFPSPRWIRAQSPDGDHRGLLTLYIRRLYQLLFRRTRT